MYIIRNWQLRNVQWWTIYKNCTVDFWPGILKERFNQNLKNFHLHRQDEIIYTSSPYSSSWVHVEITKCLNVFYLEYTSLSAPPTFYQYSFSSSCLVSVLSISYLLDSSLLMPLFLLRRFFALQCFRKMNLSEPLFVIAFFSFSKFKLYTHEKLITNEL